MMNFVLKSDELCIINEKLYIKQARNAQKLENLKDATMDRLKLKVVDACEGKLQLKKRRIIYSKMMDSAILNDDFCRYTARIVIQAAGGAVLHLYLFNICSFIYTKNDDCTFQKMTIFH